MPLRHFPFHHSDRPLIELGVLPSRSLLFDDEGSSFVRYPVVAMVDTGAGQSHVDLAVLRSFGLEPIRESELYTASTGDVPRVMPVFLIDLVLHDERPGLLMQDLEVIGSDRLAGLRVDMLLGRDVLDRCLLIYDGINRQFSLAFNPPAEGEF